MFWHNTRFPEISQSGMVLLAGSIGTGGWWGLVCSQRLRAYCGGWVAGLGELCSLSPPPKNHNRISRPPPWKKKKKHSPRLMGICPEREGVALDERRHASIPLEKLPFGIQKRSARGKKKYGQNGGAGGGGRRLSKRHGAPPCWKEILAYPEPVRVRAGGGGGPLALWWWGGGGVGAR